MALLTLPSWMEEEDGEGPIAPPKRPKPLFVDLSRTKYGTVKTCCKAMGWRITSSITRAGLIWSDCEGTIEFCKALERWQCTNHFPGMWSIAHKVEFARTYSRLSWMLPEIYNFHPKTFILPLQMDLLQAYMASFAKRSDRTVIIKPDRGSQGKGIQLIQDSDDLDDYTDSAVAQAYLVPFVMNGKKFDLRIYVLVTACDPLRAYIFRDGMVRFCTENYEQPRTKNLDNDYAHLTNFSLNKKNAAFDFSENKRSLTDVFAELEQMDVDVKKVREGIHRIVRLTLIAGQPVIASSYHTGIFTNDGKSRCFEILGFDILIDSDAKPWLLEVNCMPSLAAYSDFDEDLKTRVLSGALKIIDLDGSFKGKILRRFKEIRSQKGLPINSIFDPERESEIAKETEWQQLLPVLSNSEQSEVCEKALAAVRDFGLPKRAPPSTAPEPEHPKATKKRAAPRTKTSKAPSVSVPKSKLAPKQPAVLARAPRGMILANEARMVRLNALAKAAPVAEPIIEIFRTFPSTGNTSCVVRASEERERIVSARQQAHAALTIALGQYIRALFPNGTTPLYNIGSIKVNGPCNGPDLKVVIVNGP